MDGTLLMRLKREINYSRLHSTVCAPQKSAGNICIRAMRYGAMVGDKEIKDSFSPRLPNYLKYNIIQVLIVFRPCEYSADNFGILSTQSVGPFLQRYLGVYKHYYCTTV